MSFFRPTPPPTPVDPVDLGALLSAIATEGTDDTERAALIQTLSDAISAPGSLTSDERITLAAAVKSALDATGVELKADTQQALLNAIAADGSLTSDERTAVAAAVKSALDADIASRASQSSLDAVSSMLSNATVRVAGAATTVAVGTPETFDFAHAASALVIVTPGEAGSVSLEYKASAAGDWHESALGVITETTTIELAAPPYQLRATALDANATVEIAQ